MARPKKVGLDYFPMDLTSDDSLELLEAECGLEGFAILVKIWQKIYKNGYYIEWNEDVETLFSRKINSEKTKVNSVITTCFKRNLLNKHIYVTYGILTSRGIQKRYLRACIDSKRSYVPFIKELILVNSEFTKVISEFISINSEETRGYYGSLDTKEKEKEKGKENEREKESKSAHEEFPISAESEIAYPKLPTTDKFTTPTLKEVQAYADNSFMEIDVTEFYEHYTAAGWQMSNGRYPTDWTALLRLWKTRDDKFNRGKRKSEIPKQKFADDGMTDAMRRFANG